MSACLSDPRILSFSLGIFTVIALRWSSLPQDVATLQTLASYTKRVLVAMCSRKVLMSEHMSSTEHFPRPPRTPTSAYPTVSTYPTTTQYVYSPVPDPTPVPELQSADADVVTDTPEASDARGSVSSGEDTEEEAD